MKTWKAEGEDRKYLELIASMTTDAMLGRGVDTRETYLSNLERMIKGMRDSAEKKTDPKDSTGLGPGAWVGP